MDTPYKGEQKAKIKTINRTKGATNWKGKEMKNGVASVGNRDDQREDAISDSKDRNLKIMQEEEERDLSVK